jgi:trimethylamine--corrinoid protein Co-methyltransferase
MSRIQPRINFLTDEHINRLHGYTLKLLSTVGLRVDSQRARDSFVKAGCRFQEPDRIFLEPDLVQWAIDAAPATIDIYNRLGTHAFCLGNAKNTPTRFGIGATCLWYQDPKTDSIEAFKREHVALVTQLGDTLDHFDLVSTPGVLKEFPDHETDLRATLELVANTTKPILILNSEPAQYRNTLDMLEHINGKLSEKPCVIPYFNPVTPFVLNDDTTDKMFASIEYGLPFIFSNYGMSGATTPITAAGTLVTLNAELLGGLVLSQLIKEGASIILSSLPSVFHMKSMVTAYTPQTMLVNLACAEMMSYYDIPHMGTSGSGPGWGSDLTAGGMHWMNHLTSCLGKVGLAPHVGGNFDSVVFSPATVVYANEVIRQSRQIAEGFILDDSTVGLEDIVEVGPGGNFLTTNMTMDLFSEMDNEHSRIWPSYSLEAWQENGSPKGHDVLVEYVCDLLDHLNVPEDQMAIIEKGNAFIDRTG